MSASARSATNGPVTETSEKPTARSVITAALAVPLPCPVCGRAETCRCLKPEGYSPTESRAELVHLALIEHGHLPDPERREPTTEDYERAARWLADASRHPRYSGNGWMTILQSESDVEVASAAAEKRGKGGPELKAVRSLLLDYVTR